MLNVTDRLRHGRPLITCSEIAHRFGQNLIIIGCIEMCLIAVNINVMAMTKM